MKYIIPVLLLGLVCVNGNGFGEDGMENGNRFRGGELENRNNFRGEGTENGKRNMMDLLNDMGLRFRISNVRPVGNKVRLSIDMAIGRDSNVGGESGDSGQEGEDDGVERGLSLRNDDDSGSDERENLQSYSSPKCFPGMVLKGDTSVGCVPIRCCAYTFQIDSLCPGTDVCCFSENICSYIPQPYPAEAPTPGVTCATRGGKCQNAKTTRCVNGHYELYLCLGTSFDIRCCIPGGTQGDFCYNENSQRGACNLIEQHKAGKIVLNNFHPSGAPDDATPYLNVLYTCDGRRAARSSYTCEESQCPRGAPGSSICLPYVTLLYLESLIEISTVPVTVTSIAGGCHPLCDSLHYIGRAVNIARTGNFEKYLEKCREMGAEAADKKTHISCEFG